jgi:hypothetical protein
VQQQRPDERREFQRLTLDPSLPGTLGSKSLSIVEIGVLGARVRHTEPLDMQYAELHFSVGGHEIVLKSEVIRTFPGGTAGDLESGVRFLAAVGDSGDRLRDMLGDLVTRELDRRRTSPGGTPVPKPGSVDGDKTVRGKDAAFLCYRFEKGHWSKRPVFLPEQPSNGFTVARSSDETEIQRLCQVYEAADDEGRRLIRLFAELGISDVLEIPPVVER